MNVAEAVGNALVHGGVDHVFGVVGSGNFHVTNAMVAAGARFVASRHEGGAASMADGYARTSGRVAAVTVHQGCGLTNAMTGLTEAAKSRTPLVVLAAEVTEPRSNFYVDQAALATAVGAVPMRITSGATARSEAAAAVHTARTQRRTVLLNLPLAVQAEQADDTDLEPLPDVTPQAPDVESLAALAAALDRSERPVFVAGRGARSSGARQVLEQLAERYGALLATSAVARGLFRGNTWDLDVSGGFASPLAAELIRGADLVIGWGCALNMWTMRHGTLIGPDTTVVQVDDEPEALGRHRDIHLGVTGDVRETAAALLDRPGAQREGYRSPGLAAQIAEQGRWRDVPYDDPGDGERIDPRTLTIALDDLLPPDRVVSVDSGNFMGYPSAFLSVPDERAFCFTQAFQSIGLGLASGIGAALASPDRLPVVAVGDGGLMMSAAELDTVRRLGLPMVVVVYDDEAYGAEVHHFGPGGHPLDIVRFPPTDLAELARGFGFDGVVVRGLADLAAVRTWLDGPRERPLLVDAKVIPDRPSWWLEDAFRGH